MTPVYEPWNAARGWEPRMRKAILAHLDAGGAGLDPEVREAVARLRHAEMRP